MPIDYRIPASGNQIQPFDLGAVMDTAAKIEQARMKRQEMIDAAADEAAIAAALKSASGPQGIDYESAINALAHRPNAMMHLQTQVDEHKKKSADALKVQLDNDSTEARILSQWAGTITDQASLNFAKRVLSPDMAKFLPEQWDDQAAATMQQIAQGGMTASEKVAARKQVLDEWQTSQKTNEDDRKALLGYLSVADTAEEWDQTLKSAAQMGVSPRVIASIPAQFSPEAAEFVRQQVIGPAKLADIANTAADNTRQAASLEETKRHNIASEGIDRQRAATAAAGGGDSDDPKVIAKAIADGQQPPDMTSLYRMAGPIRAELARMGYNLTRAQEDWKATQKYFNTLNGAQQVRLRQAIGFTHDSLDIIDDLNAQWKGGRFPLLNKATLISAKQGLLGQEAQSIATRLDAQIADMVSELGTVYKGGNSSTDESLALAAKNLNAEWSEKTLTDSINLIRQNLKIRQNSIQNTGVIANPGNPYAPGAAPAGAAAQSTLPANTTTRVVQDGVTYEVTTDAAGKVISQKVIR